MFDNKNRTRYYGLRVGDIVEEYLGKECSREGEVIEYGFMDNNAVIVKNKFGDHVKCVAEWCTIIRRVEEWFPSEKVSDAVVTNDPDFCEGHSDDSVNYYGGYLIAESIPPKYINQVSAALDLLSILQRLTTEIQSNNHAYIYRKSLELAERAIAKATKKNNNSETV